MDRKSLKRDILISSYEANACHIGSALSCVDIMVDIFNCLKEDDIFIFSKASGVATYYAILAEKGYFPKYRLAEYLKNYPLPSKEVPGVIHSFGSLGHGLPVAVGMAYANRDRDVYVLMSDGECQEGTTYESALFARQHKLTNLYVIIDYNKIQALGHTKDIIDLTTAFEFLKNTIPNCEVVDTIKGQGVARFENESSWHYNNLNDIILNEALEDINDDKVYKKRKTIYLHNKKEV